MEIEAKYRAVEAIEPEQVEAVALAPYNVGPRVFHDLHDTLLDTEERALAGHRYALRVRRDGAAIFLTLKGPKRQEGSTTWRPEWEVALDGGDPDDPATWPPDFEARVRAMSGGAPLYPLFQVQNRRHTWEVTRAGVPVAEIALDRGTIRAGDLEEAMHELEVELKGGDEAELAAIVARLTAALPLTPETRGKAQRGFALLARATDDGRPTTDDR